VSVSIVFATILAAGAGVLNALHPRMWVSFHRGTVVNGFSRKAVVAGLVSASFGQAVTTSIVGLLVAILTLSVVGAADVSIQSWIGVAVILFSGVYFGRAWKQNHEDELESWPLASRLLDVAIDAKASRNQKANLKEFGPFEQSFSQTVRSVIFAPTFLLAPMFTAAAGSGLPDVWNAWPVIIAYTVCSLAGQGWFINIVGDPSKRGILEFAAERHNIVAGVAIALLGLATIFT
jgi:hypothetical protein